MNYLFILDDYYPLKSASGVCVETIVNELKRRNNTVHLLCYSSQESFFVQNNISIHTIVANDEVTSANFTCEKYKNGITRWLWLISLLGTYPIYHPVIGNRLSKQSIHIIRDYKIDKVISVVNPIESLVPVKKIRNLFPDVKFIIYELDSISDLDNRNKGIRSFLYKKRLKFEREVYNSADLIIHMKCHEKYFENKRYNLFQNKMKVVDFPLFNPSDNEVKFVTIDSSLPSLLFSGALIKGVRSPEKTIETLKMVYKSKPISVSFYSRGSYEEYLQKCSDEYLFIHRYGYVDTDSLAKKNQESDCLLSIGNLMPNMVPSKIFSYISLRKPIIHFLYIENDPCLQILSGYDLALIINVNNDIESNSSAIICFLNKFQNYHVPPFSKQQFFLNRPETTAELIDIC